MDRGVYSLSEITLVISVGDLTEADADVLVNAANNHLWMGGGVAGAIKRKGGEAIEREAVAQGPIPVGNAVVTGAGTLKARYVIHAATMGQDLRTGREMIRKATRASLAKALELGIASLAMPALGTGVGGFSLEEAAKIMISEILETQGYGSISRVEIVLFDPEAYEQFIRGVRTVLASRG